jgi:hypothetical protein
MRSTQPFAQPRRNRLLLRLGWPAVLACAPLLAGCAQPGLPLAPTLAIPAPPADLSGARVGDAVELHWTMPRRDTENVLLSGPQRATVCRAVGATPCQVVATLSFAPSEPAHWTDPLAATLSTGPAQLLTYTVELANRHGAVAAPSNTFYSAAGAAPAPVQQLTARATGKGISLGWQPAPAPAAEECLVQLVRSRVLAPGEKAQSAADSARGVPQPLEQTLEARGGCTRTEIFDRDAELNRTYSYTGTRVVQLTLADVAGREHRVELRSAPTAPARLEARDVFPPGVPTHLQAVADLDAGAIDLSWDPATESDLAGYVVYRSSAAQAPVRVSGSAPVAEASWRDAHPSPGTRYSYSVSAVDASGNESARSAAAEETLEGHSQGAAPH